MAHWRHRDAPPFYSLSHPAVTSAYPAFQQRRIRLMLLSFYRGTVGRFYHLKILKPLSKPDSPYPVRGYQQHIHTLREPRRSTADRPGRSKAFWRQACPGNAHRHCPGTR